MFRSVVIVVIDFLPEHDPTWEVELDVDCLEAATRRQGSPVLGDAWIPDSVGCSIILGTASTCGIVSHDDAEVKRQGDPNVLGRGRDQIENGPDLIRTWLLNDHGIGLDQFRLK
jgi:hypothetical protein